MRGEASRYEALLDQLEPRFRDAFLSAVQAVKDRVTIRDVEAAIAAGDMDRLAQLLDLTDDLRAAVEDVIEDAFRAGGYFQTSVGGFYPRHDRAIQWIREAGAALVVEVAGGQRAAIRGIVTSGIDDGRGQGGIARDIIGTTSRATRKREGGILGLTEAEAGYVANARRQLADLDAGYFERQARDRRFDGTVRKAMKAGKPLSQADIDRIVNRYSDGLLTRRGSRIARTEALQAINAGRYEAMRQQAKAAGLPERAVIAKWVSARDHRTRDTHRVMNGQEVRLGEVFQSPSGAVLRYPGDRAFGAPAAECVNCRCNVTYILLRGWNEHP